MKATQLATLIVVTLISLTSALSNQLLAKEASKNKGTIKLTNGNFERVLGGKKDAYMVVLLTSTNPQIGCTLCAELEPEFSTLADSWYQDHRDGLSADGEKALFFAKADFEPKKNNEVFVHFKVNNVPRLLFLSPDQDFHSFNQINLPGESGLTRIVAVLNTLKDATGISDFQVHQPINWGSIAITAVSTAVVTLFIKKYKPIAVKLATSRAIWGVGTVFVIVLWNAGYMFNSIRGSQFAGMSQDGGAVVYFMEGQQQNQFGIETQIISVIYGILASCTVGLIAFVPYAKQFYSKDKAGRPSPSKASLIELVLTLSFLVTLYVIYSALTAVFGLKSSGYPFRLFKFPSS
ncbi:LANO_0H08460g1_1 [Lachancea nothofagi CBS 11611]|uniref:LANO_0H08460g1_1 n=1 Tax=Lachancea nothofagi CBS 11611 TaxID=1266666 RepID=A0A1G4KLN3_9SACH|nr:LANO_0H08460g1_1 [Lachancea nothofagi CBS 11611]